MAVVLFAALLVGYKVRHPGSSRYDSVTTTTQPVVLSAAVATCTFVDGSRATKNYVTEASTRGRRLVTQIYYPTVSSPSGEAGTSTAQPAPASRYGPYPTIFFAQGYGIDPASYSALLDSWVRAGFVVVAPLFPDASQAAVASIGGSFADEADIANQPADLTFVTRRVLADSAGTGTGCPLLRGMVATTDLGLAGQSDGATTVGMLAYDEGTAPGASATTTYRSLSAGLGYRAVALLSGQAHGGDPYGSAAGSPALLAVQSATDQCNTPQQSVDLYSAIGQSDRWFLAIRAADHLTPYEGQDAAAFAVVSKVTAAFFTSELHHRSPGVSFVAAGNTAPTVATLTQGTDLPTWLDVNRGSGGIDCYLT
ncbi:MAG: hypothetical protein JWO62_3226 [Acidimicrobiaceae bacterium]|nr:hypothetical protein [Acidimicrobiaceae bacterium]